MFQVKEKLKESKSGFKGIGNILLRTDNFDSSWNILKDNVSLPAITLSKSALDHNQSWMKKFAEKFDFQLAPHGKTTMLPDLFLQQISSGCWGITSASATQVAAAYQGGVKRTIMANQLVGKCNMDIISTILNEDPDFEFICLVDSPENVAQLGEFFQPRQQKIKVLLEYGPMGGRTGIRDISQEDKVVEAIKNWSNTVLLVGVEFFEGVLKEEKVIRDFTRHCLSRIKELAGKDAFATTEIIISGAGTSWFDIVAEEFLNFEKSCQLSLKKILRSGCYLTYDGGMYDAMRKRVLDMGLQETNGGKCSILTEVLRPAIKVWAYVQSIPEPNLAIVGLGRRDTGTDSGYPVPHSQYRMEGNQRKLLKCPSGNCAWKVFNMMDQHTFLRINEGDDIQVGDIISFDIIHACTTMDKWKNVLLIDDEFDVIDIYFSQF